VSEHLSIDPVTCMDLLKALAIFSVDRRIFCSSTLYFLGTPLIIFHNG
jgi:hypothetical protein